MLKKICKAILLLACGLNFTNAQNPFKIYSVLTLEHLVACISSRSELNCFFCLCESAGMNSLGVEESEAMLLQAYYSRNSMFYLLILYLPTPKKKKKKKKH